MRQARNAKGKDGVGRSARVFDERESVVVSCEVSISSSERRDAFITEFC
jgi:hypothetical protein